MQSCNQDALKTKQVEMIAYRNIILIIAAVALALIAKLFFIQVLDDSYGITAANNAFRYEVQYPARGIIYDRRGEALVENITAYDIMVAPREIRNIDTAELCDIFRISHSEIRNILKEVRRNRNYSSAPFLKQVKPENFAVFQERAYRYPGFYPVVRTLRAYPRNIGGNVLGYIQEVDTATIRRNPYYKPGDYAGKSGMEEFYEDVLRGRKGVNIYLRDSRNRVVESYGEGRYDTAAVPGIDVVSSIDADLQEYAQLLMQNKLGSAVAIEPATGEVLALVSSPTFDPAELSGENRNRNYVMLQRNPSKPLFNRAIMSWQNPPGSVFKVVNGLIGLKEGVLTPETCYSCAGGYPYGRGVGCHGHFSPTNLKQAIMVSCNAYFCYVFRNLIDSKKYINLDSALMAWRSNVQGFGFARKLGVDLPGEQMGTLPLPRNYDRIHGKSQWKSLSIISLSIGQGEVGATTLQLANMCATIANRGFYYTPHIVKSIGKSGKIDEKYYEKQYCGVDPNLFAPVVEGMSMAVNSGGTAWRVRLPDIEMCGKTGTAQNPHGENHSVFVCFAPKDEPKIAVAVYVENAGYGASYAAPIAALMVEKYLKGTISRTDLEQNMLAIDLVNKPIRRVAPKPARSEVETDTEHANGGQHDAI